MSVNQSKVSPPLFVWLVNGVLLCFQVLLILVLCSMGFARESYMSVSDSVVPKADRLFDSFIVDLFIRPASGYLMLFVLFVCLVKEFLIPTLNARLMCNSISVFLFVVCIGWIFLNMSRYISIL